VSGIFEQEGPVNLNLRAARGRYHVRRRARTPSRAACVNDCAVGYAGRISYSRRTDK